MARTSQQEVGGLSGWLIARLAAPSGAVNDANVKLRLGMLEGCVSLAISLALVAIKGWLSYWSGSVALLADMLNNAGDVLISLVLVAGFVWSGKLRDKDHPYGHGRVETIAGLLISLLLILVGIETARSGILRMIRPEALQVTPIWMGVIGVTIVLKGWLFVFSRATARMSGSDALMADAWNHFYDIISTTLVLLALCGAKLGFPALDGVAGVGISLFIMYTGFHYARTMVDTLLGKKPSPEDIERVHAAAESVEGVRDVHDVIIHEYGHTKLVTCHIDIDAKLSAMEAHAIAERAEDAVADGLQAKVTIHADPVDRSHPAYERTKQLLEAMIQSDTDLLDVHDLRLKGPESGPDLAVDFVARQALKPGDYGAKLDHLKERLRQARPELKRLLLGMESEYASDPEFRREYPVEKKIKK